MQTSDKARLGESSYESAQLPQLQRTGNSGYQHRGVEYWTDGKDERIIIATGGRQLVAVNAKTGKTYSDFGRRDRSSFDYVVRYLSARGPKGLPLVKPPYGRITAIDLNRGEIVWQQTIASRPLSTPMTYMHQGKQYIVIGVGGMEQTSELIAFALPD